MPFSPKFKTLVEIYRHAIRSFPSRPLFGVKEGGTWLWMTYGEFGEKVDAMRAALEELGVVAGDRVAMIANNRVEWAVVAYATYGRGAAFVPMYEAQLDKDWIHILHDCGAKVVFTANASIRDRIKGIKGEIPSLETIAVVDGESDAGSVAYAELLERGRGKSCPLVEPDHEDIAGYIYTSGTTGLPKGVLLRHRNFAYNVSAIHEVFPLTPDDRSLSFLPWAHSFGQVVELHGLFSMGASMGIAESVPKIVDNLAEVQPTLLISVPRIFNRIYDGLHKKMAHESPLKQKLFRSAMETAAARKELAARGESSFVLDLKFKALDALVCSKVRARFGGRLKYAFSGGAAISKAVAEFIDNLGIMVYEGYGLTETSPIATANYPGHRKIGSVGRAIPGCRVEIDIAATEDPNQGEIIVHGHNVMKGYNNLPEEDAKVFTEDGGFRTGDMGYLDSDGYLFITGRIKEQYKLENGKYVVPSPLEELLKLSPFITNIMVYGDNKPYNVAIIVPDFDSLAEWAKEQGIDAGNRGALLQNPKVIAQIEASLKEYSKEFRSFERVSKFALIEEDFTTENDMLTPSLKLKRRVVMDRYGALIQGLYGAPKAAS
ncbi:MAG: long-chain fatty acid--CoA ligase [Myxococcales bacterium]|nr:long-chain fatty acid--CoA ligase [Myxococcales bacterium]